MTTVTEIPQFEQPEYGFKVDKHAGHLVAYVPRETKTVQFPSMDPNKPGMRDVDGAVATVVCVDCEKDYDDVFASQTRIYPALKDRLGQVVLGRLRQDGRAWVLDPFNDADAKRAGVYWQQRSSAPVAQPQQQQVVAPAAEEPVTDEKAIAELQAQLGAQTL